MKLMDYGDVEIHVGEDGQFRATVDGHEMKSEKLDLLQKRLDKAAEKGRASCAVPVTIIDPDPFKPPKFLRGMVTGIHRGTGNYLFSYDGGTKQLRDFDLRHCAFALTTEEEAHLIDCHVAARKASQRYEDVKHSHVDRGALDRVHKALGEVK